MTKVGEFILLKQRFSSVSGLGCLALMAIGLIWGLFSGCAGLFSEEKATESLRLACGRLCLQNGENCSQFFARKSEEKRQVFEQAKSNYWLCLKRFDGEASATSCVPPGPVPEQYDHCGSDLEGCLEGCGTSLDEMNRLAARPVDQVMPEERNFMP